MEALCSTYPGKVRAIRLRKNFGKAVALEIGFRAVTSDVVFTMDADLQDDPKEISRFIERLNDGYDLVSGWKRRRNDPPSKTIPSRIFNKVVSTVSGVDLSDFNCGFKAYKREVVENIRLYGELHRYIPVMAYDAGYRIGEIEVQHHARAHGVSKYGLERYLRGFLDLVTVLATTRYLHRPGHLLGGLGVISGFIGAVILAYLTILWFMGFAIGGRPLLLLGFMMIILSVQMLSFGVIAELILRLAAPRTSSNLVVADIGSD
jgi:glycosyltransferase involved in cell wall biosynthesis